MCIFGVKNQVKVHICEKLMSCERDKNCIMIINHYLKRCLNLIDSSMLDKIPQLRNFRIL